MEIDLGGGVKKKDTEEVKKRYRIGIIFLLKLTALLILMKLTHVIDIRWIFVFLPIWGSLLIEVVLILSFILIMMFARDF